MLGQNYLFVLFLLLVQQLLAGEKCRTGVSDVLVSLCRPSSGFFILICNSLIGVGVFLVLTDQCLVQLLSFSSIRFFHDFRVLRFVLFFLARKSFIVSLQRLSGKFV